MKERPILFTGEMVRAIIAGRKTQTRRIVKRNVSGRVELRGKQWHIEDPNAVLACPYGQPGDRLWVKETFAYTDSSLNIEPGWVYRATDPDWETLEGFKWKPSIFMQREASRLTLGIGCIRVERLQDITEADAEKEGVDRGLETTATHYIISFRKGFEAIWNSINFKRGFGWEKNPWVWVTEFKKVDNVKRRE